MTGMPGFLPRRASRPNSPATPPARRWALLSAAALAGCVLAGAVLLTARPPTGGPPTEVEALAVDQAARTPAPPGGAAPAPASPGPGGPSAVAFGGSPPVDPGAPPAPGASPVLRIPGPVPSAGRGGFRYDDRPGAVLGAAGALRRYRVAVEREAGEDAGDFGTAVQEALAGPGSWVDSGRLRLQRVPGTARHDFTVYLATAGTAARMCAAGGVDIRVGGRPYTSCRAPGKVIINLDRWRLSVPHFVAAGVPLAVYRTYVVNHEVGHQLGHGHERCPKPGRPAPVMMQQTLFLKGCVANPWPYRDGRRYAGPPL
ncbi:DUF3152 domain-containing protein [Micromonospora carbonacea subsp. aurantiaca]|uniref:DUF3152 domain-containing protein n=2 Tax=Micromonospora carbonacea TaxID=47853 RepID=A0A7H8XW28_9ACTN|nr:DUF3152 domain-containing protein [Micromonospora carbonacea]QLD28864.1 DUF3152 domain-containing protein [Micromonospora carbonacea]